VLARRTFVGGALAAALTTRAAAAPPPGRPVRLGILLFSDPGSDPNMRGVREALRELGYVEGQNLFSHLPRRRARRQAAAAAARSRRQGRRVAVIWNPNHVDDEYREIEAAGRTLGVHVMSVEVLDAPQLERAFDTIVAWKPEGLLAVSSRLIVRQRPAIIEFATKHRLPLAGGWGLWADTGALLSYGPDLDVMFRRAVGYIDRIVKGARPGDLPIEQPTKFELVINLKVAKALGVIVPQSLLVQANRVLQ
jgi:ABC-type uncharacterized transport system substrate-binding protein